MEHIQFTELDIDRFWTKVAKADCWLWLAGHDLDGYGIFSFHQSSRRAPKIAWFLATGQMPPRGTPIMHTCDTPGCVRNDELGTYEIGGLLLPRWGHLVMGTNAANSRDMVEKGRAARGDRNARALYPERTPRGESHGMAKLTEEKVRSIRNRYAEGGISQTSLAEENGVNQTKISDVVNRRTWQHVL